MSKVWPWVGGIVVGLCIVGLLVSGRADRQTYWIARGAVMRQVQATPHPVDRLMQRSPGR